jgi:O-antigen/teichoic acid export membrane protein
VALPTKALGTDSFPPARAHSLVRNVAANTASYLTTLAAAFLMFPVMIHKLGPARYGLWMLISEITGYYSYVGLGIRAGVVYYAALYLAQGKHRELNQIVSTSIWSLAGVGAALALSGFGLAALFPSLFSPAGLDLREAAQSIVVMSFAVGLSLPIEAMNSTLTAAKRLDIVNVIEMTSRAVSSVAMLICVLNGRGLVPLSLIQLGSRILVLPCLYVAILRILPGISLSPRHWHLGHLKQLGRFGLPSVMIGLGWLVSSRTDLVVIGMALGVSTVTYYAIPRSLMEYGDYGIRAIAWSFTSHLTHLHARDKTAATVQLYLQGARITGLAVFLLTAYIAAFGTPFLTVWQGSAFVTGPWRDRSSVVLLILVAAFLPRLMQNMATQLFYATNRLRFLMWISLTEGAIKIALSLLLVKPYGLAGVAFSNLMPMLIFEGLAIPAYLFRNYPFPLGAYFRDVLGRPLLTGIAAYLVSAGLVAWRQPRDWKLFFLETTLAGAVGLAAAVAIGTTAAERDAFRERGMILEETSAP